MGIELDILQLFDNNLRGFYTINAISTKLDKAYPYVHRTVHALIGLGVLRSVPVGKSLCLTVNLRNRRAVLYLTELELAKRSQLPAAVQTLAKELDAAGTLAIETVVYGDGNAYVVGSGSHPGLTTISSERFKELLLTTSLFSEHVVLAGYERFFAYLASIQQELDGKYNPLVVSA